MLNQCVVKKQQHVVLVVPDASNAFRTIYNARANQNSAEVLKGHFPAPFNGHAADSFFRKIEREHKLHTLLGVEPGQKVPVSAPLIKLSDDQEKTVRDNIYGYFNQPGWTSDMMAEAFREIPNTVKKIDFRCEKSPKGSRVHETCASIFRNAQKALMLQEMRERKRIQALQGTVKDDFAKKNLYTRENLILDDEGDTLELPPSQYAKDFEPSDVG